MEYSFDKDLRHSKELGDRLVEFDEALMSAVAWHLRSMRWPFPFSWFARHVGDAYRRRAGEILESAKEFNRIRNTEAF